MDNEIFEGIDYKSFEFVKTLGKGTHGTVILAQQKNNKKKYAIKSIKKQSFDNDKQLSLIKREVDIMAALSHPHIITVHDVCESSSRVTMTLEYASGGELFDYVNESPGGLDEVESRRIFNQISSAVLYLHRKGIVHRDLKLENILLDCNGDAKIADFGLANLYSRDKLLFTYCGSPLYASPEIVKAEPYFGPEVDCWSLGVILYAMSFGVLPFDDSDVTRLKRCIVNGEYLLPQQGSPLLKNLITRMLEPVTDQRLIMKEVVGHPWLNEVADVTSSWPYYYSHRPSSLASPEAALGSPYAYPLLDYELRSEINRLHNSCPKCTTFGHADKSVNGNPSPNFGREEPFTNHICRNEDGNFSTHLGNACGKKTNHCQDVLPHHSPKLNQNPFQDTSLNQVKSQINPAVGAFTEVHDFMSVKGENSVLEDEETASVPVICEVRQPKHISLPGDVNIVCDCKTSSTNCLDAVLPTSLAEPFLLTRAKSEPFCFSFPQERSSASMFFSSLSCRSRATFFREESLFVDSLNCERSDSFNFNGTEATDCRSSEYELIEARRRLVFGQPDSLEGTEMYVVQSAENDDDFSVDSLDL